MIRTGENLSTRRKSCTAPLRHKPHIGLGLNVGLRHERPTTYCLSHDTVIKKGMHAGFWCGNLRETDHLEDLDLE
jgi:hypothetical protein